MFSVTDPSMVDLPVFRRTIDESGLSPSSLGVVRATGDQIMSPDHYIAVGNISARLRSF